MLGPPRFERDGEALPGPRSRKTWGLLAYLALGERPPARSRLASLLFPEADDPLGALRWSVAELRRLLGDPNSIGGDPLILELQPGAVIDIVELSRSERMAPDEQLTAGELLEGLSFPSSAVFESWLLVARRHAAGVVQGSLRDAALELLAAGDVNGATTQAERLLELDPLEPAAHELVVRCLTRRGDRRAAQRQLAAARRVMGESLGIAADQIENALARPDGLPAVGDADAALAQLQAGRAALDAGAVEPGIACLRLATAEAESCGDDQLLARALSELGSALVHAVRSRDEEGAAVLYEALALAERTQDRATTATVLRELGYIDVQAGRIATAGRWLARATEIASGDEELCAVLGVRGMALSDRAYYGAALDLLDESVRLARRCGRARQLAWSRSLAGRVHLLRGDVAAAEDAIEESLATVKQERWAAFRPWPEALLAELELHRGDLEAASARVDRAFRLSCQLGDPCWEGMTMRARALVSAARGESPDGTVAILEEARVRTTRVSDPYQWVHGQILDALAAAAIEAGSDVAPGAIDASERLADRTGMRELAARARLHRARLGEPQALDSARLLGAEIDNPALSELLARAPSHATSHGSAMS